MLKKKKQEHKNLSRHEETLDSWDRIPKKKVDL